MGNWRTLRLGAAVIGWTLLCSGCKEITSGDLPTEGEMPGDVADTITIVIQDFAFRAPNGTDSVTVPLGKTIRFVNLDVAPHTATSTTAPATGDGFDTGRLAQGEEYHWTPSTEGLRIYRCDFHPVEMSGAMIRVGGGDVPPDTLDPGDGGGDPSLSDTILVELVNFSFRGPDGTGQVRVSPGQTLKFVNRDEADHTVTSTSAPPGAAGFDSGNLEPGQVFHWTPSETGTWSYVCDYHPEMTGAVVVSDSTGGGDPPEPVTVEITDGGFVGPGGDGDVTVSVGQTVTWVNTGTQVHTASATDAPDGAGRFDSGELDAGDSFGFTPDRPGVWRYRCDEHSAEPEGTITVQ